eukprot:TRINITY_DN27991_c0_g1_i2.p1 TRINITY_DN27991_c0_g1~~TRINITY_DN27991_c0_g1_i2.p1  ORF type:complete len:343 (+),score=82.55 TRINITY_DN27991_c0_g1_i2:28-1056(+)
MSTKKVLIIGATGYIGGTVLAKLLQQPNILQIYSISVLIRDPNQSSLFQPLGVQTIVGSLSDSSLLTQISSQHDIVLQLADADHLDGTTAILSGLHLRSSTSKSPVYYLHNSGTGVLADSSYGLSSTTTIYTDSSMDQISSIPDSAPHRNVDILVLSSGNDTLKTLIICPPLIYGKGLGLVKILSQQIPVMIQAALKNDQGKVYVPGQGKNVWSNVGVEDLGDFYVMILRRLVEMNGEGVKVNGEGYYFVESGDEESFERIGEEIVEGLKKEKKEKQWEVENVERERWEKVFGKPEGYVKLALASNSRSRAEKARKLGWEPKTHNFHQDIHSTVKDVINGVQ